MKNYRLYSVLLLVGFLSSCGKKEEPAYRQLITLTEEQIEYVMDNQAFECASIQDKKCPEGIGRVFFLNKKDAERSHSCSGFLISNDTLVTNNHCVTKSTCEDTYIAVYYNDGTYLNTKCEEVIYTDNSPVLGIDATVLKLKEVYLGSTFDKIGKKPNAGEMAKSWVVDQMDLYNGRITEIDCEVVASQYTYSVDFKNCPAMKGNSGSVFLNSLGEVVGILYGGIESKDESKRISKDTELDVRRENKDITVSATEINFVMKKAGL